MDVMKAIKSKIVETAGLPNFVLNSSTTYSGLTTSSSSTHAGFDTFNFFFYEDTLHNTQGLTQSII